MFKEAWKWLDGGWRVGVAVALLWLAGCGPEQANGKNQAGDGEQGSGVVEPTPTVRMVEMSREDENLVLDWLGRDTKVRLPVAEGKAVDLGIKGVVGTTGFVEVRGSENVGGFQVTKIALEGGFEVDQVIWVGKDGKQIRTDLAVWGKESGSETLDGYRIYAAKLVRDETNDKLIGISAGREKLGEGYVSSNPEDPILQIWVAPDGTRHSIDLVALAGGILSLDPGLGQAEAAEPTATSTSTPEPPKPTETAAPTATSKPENTATPTPESPADRAQRFCEENRESIATFFEREFLGKFIKYDDYNRDGSHDFLMVFDGEFDLRRAPLTASNGEKLGDVIMSMHACYQDRGGSPRTIMIPLVVHLLDGRLVAWSRSDAGVYSEPDAAAKVVEMATYLSRHGWVRGAVIGGGFAQDPVKYYSDQRNKYDDWYRPFVEALQAGREEEIEKFLAREGESSLPFMIPVDVSVDVAFRVSGLK